MGKLKIKISPRFAEEKKYIIDVLFSEFLGLTYDIEMSAGTQHYEIQLHNGNNLIIEDHFFNKIKNDTYLKEENIPQTVCFARNQLLNANDLPIAYGNNSLKIEKKRIQCGTDIFAFCFFMLTRWEEYVIKKRDSHQRFPGELSLAYRKKFLDRPVVNEYTEFLWNLLAHLGINQSKKGALFKLYITHDVDFILKWIDFGKFIRSILGDLILRKSIFLAFNNVKKYHSFKKKRLSDPFDTFDYLMTKSEEIGEKSYFFFMSGGRTKFDNHYPIEHPRVLEVINEIEARGHFIGIHPSYNAAEDSDLLRREIEKLGAIANQAIHFGRQHYLRTMVPVTWQVWEDCHMKWDSSLYYTGHHGFRAGCCYPYSVYNFLTRKKLNLVEKPLLLMDVNLLKYKNFKRLKRKIFSQIETVKKFNGEYILLWHNSNLNTFEWKKFRALYEDILANIAEKI